MPVKVGVLLVHGIGTQKEGATKASWEPPLTAEVLAILKEQHRDPQSIKLNFAEYSWDPRVRAFSGLAVTTWALMSLPRLLAIHTALNYGGRGPNVDQADSMRTILASFLLRMWNIFCRGLLTPYLATVLICLLWIVNPPIVLFSGVASFLMLWKWKSWRKPRWKPIRLANLLMARIVGDAYMWLASPLGRIFSKGSQRRLTADFIEALKPLYDDNSKVVIVAHSQGAAIVVKALEEWRGKLPKPTRLVTVGGGHRLLQGLEDSISGRTNKWLSPLYTAVSVYIVARVLVFQYYYLGSLLLWFGVTPLWATNLLLETVIEDSGPPVSPSWNYLAEGMASRLLEQINGMTITVFVACAISVGLATFRFGRPAVPRLPTLPCSWTEVWSRFDPVCIGPPQNLVREPTAPVLRRNISKVTTAETWILKWRVPFMEHTSYFLPASPSLRAMAMSIVWQGNSLDVPILVPGDAATVRLGLLWIRIFKALLAFWFVITSLGLATLITIALLDAGV